MKNPETSLWNQLKRKAISYASDVPVVPVLPSLLHTRSQYLHIPTSSINIWQLNPQINIVIYV
jgi:hypothetical protein